MSHVRDDARTPRGEGRLSRDRAPGATATSSTRHHMAAVPASEKKMRARVRARERVREREIEREIDRKKRKREK